MWPIDQLYIELGEEPKGMETSRGHFFSKWANPIGHIQRVNFRAHENSSSWALVANLKLALVEFFISFSYVAAHCSICKSIDWSREFKIKENQ